MTARAWGKRNIMYRQNVVKVASYLVSLSVGVSRSRNMDLLGAADSLWERFCRPSSAGVGSIIVAQSNLSSLLQFSVLDVSVKFDARPHNACSNLDKFATTPVICWLSIWHCITLFWCVLLDLFVFFCSLLINLRLSFFKPLPQIIVWLLVRSCMGVTNSVAKWCQLEWKVKSKTLESHRLCQQYRIYNDTSYISSILESFFGGWRKENMKFFRINRMLKIIANSFQQLPASNEINKLFSFTWQEYHYLERIAYYAELRFHNSKRILIA